jgi:hypothetical protein
MHQPQHRTDRRGEVRIPAKPIIYFGVKPIT